MPKLIKRSKMLALAGGGMLLAGGCHVGDSVLATIELALRIVDVWV
jgi:hypothetical protein